MRTEHQCPWKTSCRTSGQRYECSICTATQRFMECRIKKLCQCWHYMVCNHEQRAVLHQRLCQTTQRRGCTWRFLRKHCAQSRTTLETFHGSRQRRVGCSSGPHDFARSQSCTRSKTTAKKRTGQSQTLERGEQRGVATDSKTCTGRTSAKVKCET